METSRLHTVLPAGEITELEKSCYELADRADENVTVDAFIRNLALGGDDSQTEKHKAVLSIFFAVEQRLVRPDPRYNHWFANILRSRSSQPELPEGISVLTWNYDLQMPLAYCSSYRQNSIHDARNTLNEFTLRDKSGNFNREFIIHLNGIAEAVNTSGEYQLLDKVDEDVTDTIHYAYAYFKDVIKGRPSIRSSIEFAWETSDGKGEQLIQLCARLKSVTTLVCIGYSFPRFNRETDKTILDSMVNLKRVILQFPGNAHESIRPRLADILGREVEFVYNSDCSTFHIA